MKILPYISPNKIYYDASFTRFYIDYKNDNNAKRIIPLIKRIWDERDIYIIEGELTRLGMGNNLLDNAKSIHRIIAPPLNAFEKYDEIMAAVKGYAPKSVLILIALGMTATCLAYDLSKEGYQAIDIGHVDIEYEWFLMRSPKRVAIKNKYVSESNERFISDGIKDELYNSQIVARVL
jgi:glycosyltransferase family protein